MNKRWNTATLSLLCLLLVLSATYSVAQVALPVSNLGPTSFEDGTANPGWAVEQYIGYYDGGQMRDSNGNSLQVPIASPQPSRWSTLPTTRLMSQPSIRRKAI
jgi:hypothetical protein